MVNEEAQIIKAEAQSYKAKAKYESEKAKFLSASIKAQAKPKPLTKWIGPSGPATPAPMLTRQQMILREMMGSGERNWGTGRNLPVINHDLNNPNGGGIIKSRDGGQTGAMFGMRR